ncbi:MAG: hypothetical protein ACLS2X_01980 [Coprococcus sp.]
MRLGSAPDIVTVHSLCARLSNQNRDNFRCGADEATNMVSAMKVRWP